MPASHSPKRITLTDPKYLQTLTENRRFFNLQHCELNVFETYQPSWHFPLTFGDFVVTSMVRGKKIMHLHDQDAFDYLPGESVIVPANETMVIDFPEAEASNPTQCIALAVDSEYIRNTVHYLNDYYNSSPDEKIDWQLHCSQYHFHNDTDVAALINKLINVCSSDDRSKNIFADLNLKELLIRIIQSQRLHVLTTRHENNNHSRLHFVLQYIHEHLTEKIAVNTLSRKAYLSRNIFFKWFKEQFGLTPLEYITAERIHLARQLLGDERRSISDIALQCGFNDTNYFVRAFRRSEGITPGAYRLACRK